MKITSNELHEFKMYLIREEKSPLTLYKYMSDVSRFAFWTEGRVITKEDVIRYKECIAQRLAPTSVNSVISSLNSFFSFFERYDLKVKTIKIQRRIFANPEKELTKSEYQRLLKAAKSSGNSRLYYLMQTVCSVGIRVSELRCITVEALRNRQAIINSKGKYRVIMLPPSLCITLQRYASERKIKSGYIFCTKTGKPLDRSNIWLDMKKLCKDANVLPCKVFPHNLRHLFARTYYSIQKDIVRLADILGHSNVNTTRIYTVESGDIHRKQIEELGLLLC